MTDTDTALCAPLLAVRDNRPFVEGRRRTTKLHRVRAGVFMAAEDWQLLPPWDRYRRRVDAVGRTWAHPIFCLESAAVLHDLPIFGEPRHIHLLNPGGPSWRSSDVVVHGTRDDPLLTTIDDCRVTTREQTTADLCRVLPPAYALAVADHTLRRRNTTPFDISAFGRAQSNRRGLRQLDWVQATARAAAESVGESVSRAVISWLGYEDPDLQVEFAAEGCLDRVDFWWGTDRLIGESDGWGKYNGPDAAAVKSHFVAEKRREDRLRRQGNAMVRWEWADTQHPSRLDAKLQLGGLHRVRPRQDTMLATLAQNPRSFSAAELRERAAAAPVRSRRGPRAPHG